MSVLEIVSGVILIFASIAIILMVLFQDSKAAACPVLSAAVR